MNKPIIFYHLWPSGDWKEVNKIIFEDIVKGGLNDEMQSLYICVNTDLDFNEIELHGINKDKVIFERVRDTQTEWPTIDKLYQLGKDLKDTPILYMHCKGARLVQGTPSHDAIRCWTSGMSYYCAYRYKRALSLLEEGKPTLGIRVERSPRPHYSGNFWWINSNFLNNLPNPSTQDWSFNNRYGNEFWIGSSGYHTLFDLDERKSTFSYNSIIPRSEYAVNTDKRICLALLENTSTKWLNSTRMEYEVYTKNNNLKRNSIVEAYLTYIVKNYDNLPKFTYFLKSSAIVKVPNLNIILKNNYLKFTSFGTIKTKDDNKGNPNHPGLDIKGTWEKYFSTECPQEFKFIAESNFGVTDKEILQYPKELYETILAGLEEKDSPIEDFCFERFWSNFFTSNVEGKLSQENIGSGDSLIEYPDVDFYENKIDYKTIVNQINSSEKTFTFFINSNNRDEELIALLIKRMIDNVNVEYVDNLSSLGKYCMIRNEYLKKNIEIDKIVKPFIKHLKEIYGK